MSPEEPRKHGTPHSPGLAYELRQPTQRAFRQGSKVILMSDSLRHLPSVNEVLETEHVKELLREKSHDAVVSAIRQVLDAIRIELKAGASLDGLSTVDAIGKRVVAKIEDEFRPRLRSVINATGIVLHTNLGRAPLAEEAAKKAQEAGQGYLNLELDLETGKRSSRQNSIREWLCRLTGAESATAVNNCAAATVIVLRALCAGREVIVSRGQLIEIGGSFRIPEIMAVSGATLREVGTTNITRISDYEKAISPNTAALMRVHTSNYRISGFTESASLEELVGLGRKHGLPVIDDCGSGALIDFDRFGFQGEPIVAESIKTGADLALFSGDKLLGGPQAGIIVGRKQWIDKIEKDPLMRAFRLDKMTLAALEVTLRIHLNPDHALVHIPVLQMLGAKLEDLRKRAESLADRIKTLPGLKNVSVQEEEAFVGGGSLPDQAMKSIVVALQTNDLSVADLAHRLRTGDPAVLGRVQQDRLILDLRTVFLDEEDHLLRALQEATAAQL
jgi:L-seryl-tRNA(Ser) seleniumtransferase